MDKTVFSIFLPWQRVLRVVNSFAFSSGSNEDSSINSAIQFNEVNAVSAAIGDIKLLLVECNALYALDRARQLDRTNKGEGGTLIYPD